MKIAEKKKTEIHETQKNSYSLIKTICEITTENIDEAKRNKEPTLMRFDEKK